MRQPVMIDEVDHLPAWRRPEAMLMVMQGGVWLALSPWSLGFAEASTPRWNALVGGLLVLALALWNLRTIRSRPPAPDRRA